MIPFWNKYFTTKIDPSYSDSLNLFKTTILFSKRSKWLFFVAFIIPLLIFFISISASDQQEFFIVLFRVFAISITIMLTTVVAFELNNTSFFKKIIISTGIKRYQMFIPGIVVFFYQLIQLGIIFAYFKIYFIINSNLPANQLPQVLSWDYFYTIIVTMIVSIMIGLLIANFFKIRTTAFSFALFFSFLIVSLTIFNLYVTSKFYSQLSYITPYRYLAFLERESLNQNNFLNLTGTSIFNIKTNYYISHQIFDPSYTAISPSEIPNFSNNSTTNASSSDNPWISIFLNLNEQLRNNILKDLQNWNLENNSGSSTKNVFLIIANLDEKIVNLVMPWVFIAIFIGGIFLLDPLKTRKYQ
ncbi:hypothetical protein MCAV_05600 [[Mycoplasma] cavipharyngis]